MNNSIMNCVSHLNIKTSHLIAYAFLFLSVLSLGFSLYSPAKGQSQSLLGSITLTVRQFETRELSVSVHIEIHLYFKEDQNFNWFTMHLVHIQNNDLREITNINLTTDMSHQRNYDGTGELVFQLDPSRLYPFDEYNLTLILYNDESFNQTRIEMPYIEANLETSLQSNWIVKNNTSLITSDRNLLPDGREFVCFELIICRQPYVMVWSIAPTLLSLAILYLATFLDPNRRDWLSNRITIYMSLFVFVFTFQAVVLSNIPLRIGVSPAELLIYLVAVDTVILFLFSILRSLFSNETLFVLDLENSSLPHIPVTIELAGLSIVGLVDAFVFMISFSGEGTSTLAAAFGTGLLLFPISIGVIFELVRARRFKNIDYLVDYVTTAVSEGLATNVRRGINHLVKIVEEAIPSYEKEMPDADRILSFLSDILIVNMNSTHIRELILRSYESLFELGAQKSSIITYTITTQFRMLSEQITKKETALAARGLLTHVDNLVLLSLRKGFAPAIVDDSCTAYVVVSKDILREKVTMLVTWNTLLLGSLLLDSTKRMEIENVSLRLLNLLDEYVEGAKGTGDTNLTYWVNYYARQTLGWIKPGLRKREVLLNKANEIEAKIK